MNIAERFRKHTVDHADDLLHAVAIDPSLSIDHIIAIHKAWDERLYHYVIGSSKEDMQPEVLRTDDRCILGTWLHGAGQRQLGSYVTFTKLLNTHRDFHHQAAEIVALKQIGQVDKALELLHGKFQALSQEIIQDLRGLRALV
ncbi:MAG: CZB domain-containing protein [Pseudomonadales bacterium]|nr:CZB domain-containing protein [Pseudomonadales bacterium]